MAGTAIEQPRRGETPLAPGENRSETNCKNPGVKGDRPKSPEAVDIACNEYVIEG
jgi:hypothetical protein